MNDFFFHSAQLNVFSNMLNIQYTTAHIVATLFLKEENFNVAFMNKSILSILQSITPLTAELSISQGTEIV